MTPDPDIVVRDLVADELDEAVAVLGRGMRDNPLHIAAYGGSPERRRRCHERLMRGLLSTSTGQTPICAVWGDRIVGVTGVAASGTCQPGPLQQLRLLPTVLGLGPRTAGRVLRWSSIWGRRDPDEPHVHLGPFAVDTEFQGRGIGSRILAEHCKRLDAAGQISYLETDREINVSFYKRCGFTVLGRDSVLGVPCWYMARQPAPGLAV